MDRSIYIAMSNGIDAMMAQEINTNNLANANTNGFKTDHFYFRSLYLKNTGINDRAYAVINSKGVSLKSGSLDFTGRPMDIALNGNAWLVVNTPDGQQSFLHSAQLQVNQNGFLVTQHGLPLSSISNYSISIPKNAAIYIDKDGGIHAKSNGQTSLIDTLKVISLPEKNLHKDSFGLIRVNADTPFTSDQLGGKVKSGLVEKSNVSAPEALINMIDIARQYETDINFMSTEKNNDRSSNQLLSLR